MNIISPNHECTPWRSHGAGGQPLAGSAAPAMPAVGRADRALPWAGNFGRGPRGLLLFPCGPWTLLPFLLRALPTCCLPSEDPGAAGGGPSPVPRLQGTSDPFHCGVVATAQRSQDDKAIRNARGEPPGTGAGTARPPNAGGLGASPGWVDGGALRRGSSGGSWAAASRVPPGLVPGAAPPWALQL